MLLLSQKTREEQGERVCTTRTRERVKHFFSPYFFSRSHLFRMYINATALMFDDDDRNTQEKRKEGKEEKKEEEFLCSIERRTQKKRGKKMLLFLSLYYVVM